MAARTDTPAADLRRAAVLTNKFVSPAKAEARPPRLNAAKRLLSRADTRPLGSPLHRQEKEREDRIAQLKAAERADLADLTERHQQQQREHSFRYDDDRARRLRELDAAANRLAETEARRRQEEREAEQRRTRDGPPPPGRAR